MEGYTNIGGSHFDFNDLDIEGRNSDELKQDKTKRSSNAQKVCNYFVDIYSGYVFGSTSTCQL